MKGYTNFMAGFSGVEAIATKPIGAMKYMDWKKVKKICEENPHSTICAGLQEDWGWTAGTVFKSGEWIKDAYVHGCSCWATPIIDVDGEEIECWTYEKTEENLPSWWGEK